MRRNWETHPLLCLKFSTWAGLKHLYSLPLSASQPLGYRSCLDTPQRYLYTNELFKTKHAASWWRYWGARMVQIYQWWDVFQQMTVLSSHQEHPKCEKIMLFNHADFQVTKTTYEPVCFWYASTFPWEINWFSSVGSRQPLKCHHEKVHEEARFPPKPHWRDLGFIGESCYCLPVCFLRFLKHNNTHIHTKTYKQANLAKLQGFLLQQGFRLKLLSISLRWRRNCWHTETAQYSWGHVHPWGDKGYSLKTCRVQVFN